MFERFRDWCRRHPLFVASLALSASAHVLGLIALIVNFAWPHKFEDAPESVPVEMVTTSDLNQIMNGEKTAQQMDKPQRRVDQVAELEDHKPAPPLAEAKKDTPPPPAPDKANNDPGDDDKTTEANAPPPPPAETPAPPVPTPPARPVEASEAPKPPPKPEEVKPPPEDAEALEPKPPPRPKTAEPKKEPKPPKKVAKVVPPAPPKRPDEPKPEPKRKEMLDQVAKLLDNLKPPKPATKARSGNEAKDAKPSSFSVDRITALLDHQAPQRKASTGHQLTRVASLGSPTSHAEKLSPSMQAQIDGWLIDHYRGCWSYFGLGATQNYVPKVHVMMAPDGSLIGTPVLLNPPSDPNLRSLADSAMRAVNRCNPMPVPAWFKDHYQAWRDRAVRFDPKEMS